MTSSLHVIATNAPRGAETFAIQLASALREREEGAYVVALTPSDSAAAHEVDVLGRNRRSPAVLRKLRLLSRNFDVVVAHGSSTLEACAIALLGTRTPFVYRMIGDPAYWTSDPMRRLWVGRLLRRATSYVALWPAAADALARRYRIGRERIAVIANAVPEGRFPEATPVDRTAARQRLGLTEDLHYVASVGALSPEKNVLVALRSVEHIDSCTILIAGEGPQRAYLEGFHRARPAISARFLGSLSDLWDVYAAADLLLLPSRTEGMPAVVIEAGLVGTPTLATAVGAIPHMLIDGETGYLSREDDDDEFVKRVHEVLPGAQRIRQDVSAAFRSRFAMKTVAERWIETLQRCS